MARETKQDRAVRGMLDQVIEHLHELISFEASTNTKEADIEKWTQSFLRNCLGFTASSGYSIRAQESKGKHRPDLIVSYKEKPIFVVEVKKLGFDLGKSDFRNGKAQLSEYLKVVGDVKYGILTNGTEWKLYDFSDLAVGGIEMSDFDIKGDSDQVETSKKAVEDLCYEMIDFHESSYASEVWYDLAKEATAFSFDSLAKAILSADVVKHIAKAIRGEHEYKANLEILSDRVYDLLEKGLNDAIRGWNEAKEVELHKYLKAQKRSARRTRKSKAPVVTTTGELSESKEAVEKVESTAVAEQNSTEVKVA